MHAKENNYGVVKEFVGHSVGKDMHEEPKIPNYGRAHTGPTLKAGMTLAIEPRVAGSRTSTNARTRKGPRKTRWGSQEK
jgi:methionyl aminopeptidase